MSRRLLSVVTAVLSVGLAIGVAEAQQQGKDRKVVNAESKGGIGDAFKGFGSNAKDPIQIEADSLEVRDKENMAVFTGNVLVRQKDTVMKTAVLKVFYEAKGSGEKSTENQQVRRYEADGKVLITQNSQTVTGESGWFDMRAQKAQINNNVVVTQEKNVVTGGRLDVNLVSGEYTLSNPPGNASKSSRPTIVFEPADSHKN